MPNSQDDDLLAIQIEADTVISHPKPSGSQFRLLKQFGVGERAHSLLIVTLDKGFAVSGPRRIG
jgi:hypothetical protein